MRVFWSCVLRCSGALNGLRAIAAVAAGLLLNGLLPGPGELCTSCLAQRSGDDPALRSQLLQFEPETAEQTVAAVTAAERLQRPLDARQYLRKLLDRNPTPQELLALRRKFGVGQFLKFNANPELQPEARELLLAVNAATRVYAPSDTRLQELVQQLAGEPSVAADAIVEILAAEGRAVPVLLAADPATPVGRVAEQVLQKYARQLRRGLLAVLPTAAAADRVRVLELLGTTADPELIPELLRWQFAADVPADTVATAAAAVRRLAGTRPVPATAEQAVQQLLQTAAAELQLAGQRFSRQDLAGVVVDELTAEDRSAAVARAQTLARDAVIIAPSDTQAAAMQLASQLAAVPAAVTDANGVPPQAADAALLTSTLILALQTENPAAATGALRGLRQLSADELTAGSAELPSVVRRALEATDPRVRLLAAQLTLEQPQLTDTALAHSTVQAARTGSTRPEAVVIDADAGRRNELAEALQDAGYQTEAVRTGIRGFEAAVGQLHCELILIHSNCIQWDLSPTVANLRADARTRNTPIVIYGPEYTQPSAASLARRQPGIWYISEPVGVLTLVERMRFVQVAGPLLSEAERTEMQALVAPDAAAN